MSSPSRQTKAFVESLAADIALVLERAGNRSVFIQRDREIREQTEAMARLQRLAPIKAAVLRRAADVAARKPAVQPRPSRTIQWEARHQHRREAHFQDASTRALFWGREETLIQALGAAQPHDYLTGIGRWGAPYSAQAEIKRGASKTARFVTIEFRTEEGKDHAVVVNEETLLQNLTARWGGCARNVQIMLGTSDSLSGNPRNRRLHEVCVRLPAVERARLRLLGGSSGNRDRVAPNANLCVTAGVIMPSSA